MYGARRLDSLSDNALMRKIRDGEVERLGLLFERHSGQLFNFLLRLTGNRALSEDLVQDVFFRVLKHRQTFREDGEFTVWLYRIARNAHVDHLRTRRPERPFEDELHSDAVAAAPNRGVDEVLEKRQETALLFEALDRLPVEKRELLVLSCLQRRKSPEVARILSCTAGTVRTRVHRALADLRGAFMEVARERAQ